ncbi:DUF1214 domain-containing protein [Aliiruegeria sabulilitoris]|uniref:DUF1214 domain-containing protein n=1 Tax=Aliiruegeria sabulilitoris TaxID=1510458 RepID=UPI0008355E4B|nr:DUF1214 domain-containing protein [Aliiruegeria sabulilitoris]NDR59433.1 DUF1214 domain-containing protein [Pseudoruegeria sp. M32A2M]
MRKTLTFGPVAITMAIAQVSPATTQNASDNLRGFLDGREISVPLDNFVRAASDIAFRKYLSLSGGVNAFVHIRTPTPIDQQATIRMNCDTLYCIAVIDIGEGATLILPDTGAGYISAQVINQDHDMNAVFVGGASHTLDVETFDGLVKAPVELARFGTSNSGVLGTKGEVDPIRAASYVLGCVDKTDGETPCKVTVKDVPVDAFGSVTVHNAEGYLEANGLGVNSYNNFSTEPNEDGAFTLHFGDCGDERVNCIPVTPGWNYAVRMYQPREEILDGRWKLPAAEPA